MSPAVDDDERVFWPSMEGKLAAFNGLDGDKLWEVTIQSSRSSVSLGHDGTVYVAGFGSELLALDPDSGEIIWKSALSSFSEGVTIGNNSLVVADYAGYLTKFNNSGDEEWKFCHTENGCDGSFLCAFSSAIQGTPVLYENSLFFGSYDGNVYVIE